MHCKMSGVYFALVFLLLFQSASAAETEQEPEQIITRAESFSVVAAPEKNFTGNANFSRFPTLPSSTDMAPAIVNFEAGARSNWHTHAKGQYLIVTEGEGRTQQWGKPIQVIRAGDTVWCPPGVKHWHGAGENTAMTHVVISPVVSEGPSVTWLEPAVLDKNAEATPEQSLKHLSLRHQQMIPIAAFTASGNIEKLTPAIHSALDAGLSVSEAREIMIQLYAYTGFPRSLNALNTLADAIAERKEQGIDTQQGQEATPLPKDYNANSAGNAVRNELVGRDMTINTSRYAQLAPVIDVYLKEHLFGDIFSRDVLNYQDRELVTISALAAMSGTDAQLKGHLTISLNVGLTKPQLQDFAAVLQRSVGSASAQRARQLLNSIP